MKRTLQLIACASAFWLAAPPTATADSITITSGTITLPGHFATAPMTLTGTDGTRPFTFNGFISLEAAFGANACPCVSQIDLGIDADTEVFGNVTYGAESYATGGGNFDTEGRFLFSVLSGAIALPTPLTLGETQTFSAPFTASGTLLPPVIPGTGLQSSLSGSGIATVMLMAGPGTSEFPLVWELGRADYQFGDGPGGPAPVPEPASCLLIASGLSALALKRRSRAGKRADDAVA